MTHEHFVIWLQGLLVGDSSISEPLRQIIMEKIETIDAMPVPKSRDVPQSEDSIWGAPASPNPPPFVTLPKYPGVMPGVFLGDPSVMMTNHTALLGDATIAQAKATSGMATLSAAAKACE